MKRGKKPFTIDLLVQRGRIPETWYDDIIQLGKEGSAEVHIVSYMDISWKTHKLLMDRCPEYLQAVNDAQRESEKWWFEIAKKEWVNGNSKSINSNHWSLIVRNMFKDRWSDKKDVDITSKGDKINDNTISVEIIKKTQEDGTNESND